MVDIVNGLLVANGKVLMALRSNHRRSYRRTWSFPGGHVETSETLEAALQRELMEEIGVEVISSQRLMTLKDTADGITSDVTFHLFKVESWQAEPVNLGNEHARLSWKSIEEAKLLPNLALEGYLDVLDRLDVPYKSRTKWVLARIFHFFAPATGFEIASWSTRFHSMLALR